MYIKAKHQTSHSDPLRPPPTPSGILVVFGNRAFSGTFFKMPSSSHALQNLNFLGVQKRFDSGTFILTHIRTHAHPLTHTYAPPTHTHTRSQLECSTQVLNFDAGYCRILQDTAGYRGILQDTAGYCGILLEYPQTHTITSHT